MLAALVGGALTVAFGPRTLRADKEPVSDDLLYDRVNRALITDPKLGSRQLAVRVADGVVTVTGFVETKKLKKRVKKVVKKVNGVKEIRNQVTVRPY